MADRRRRRKLNGDEDSDGGSEASQEGQNGVRKATVVSIKCMSKGKGGGGEEGVKMVDQLGRRVWR